MKLWLVRHAPVLLPPGLCYGASDVPADETISQQTAQQLAKLLPHGVPVVVSGLQRAQMLAQQLVALRPDLGRPRTDVRLNEMNFGHWELQPWDHIPRTAFDTWMASFAHHRFGGEESTHMIIQRVAEAMQDKPQEEAVWVTHAGVIRAAKYVAQYGHAEIESVDQWPTDAPAPGEWTTLHWNPPPMNGF